MSTKSIKLEENTIVQYLFNDTKKENLAKKINEVTSKILPNINDIFQKMKIGKTPLNKIYILVICLQISDIYDETQTAKTTHKIMSKSFLTDPKFIGNFGSQKKDFDKFFSPPTDDCTVVKILEKEFIKIKKQTKEIKNLHEKIVLSKSTSDILWPYLVKKSQKKSMQPFELKKRKNIKRITKMSCIILQNLKCSDDLEKILYQRSRNANQEKKIKLLIEGWKIYESIEISSKKHEEVVENIQVFSLKRSVLRLDANQTSMFQKKLENLNAADEDSDYSDDDFFFNQKK